VEQLPDLIPSPIDQWIGFRVGLTDDLANGDDGAKSSDVRIVVEDIAREGARVAPAYLQSGHAFIT
jgi:hypothetical protein